jgi:upstream activation factor subunit UAF30
MQRFDQAAPTPTNVVPTVETAPPEPPTNGTSAAKPVKRETNGTSKKRPSPTPDDDDELSSVADSPPPKRAKVKQEIKQSQAETDEEYAKRLQAELNRVTGRSTRGGGATTKRKPVVKSQRKKKSKARVGSDDDSDAEGAEKKEVKRTGGFHVCLQISPTHNSVAFTNHA